jgi:hypothetical protein
LFSAGASVSNHAPFAFAHHFILPNVHEVGWFEAFVDRLREYEITHVFPAHDDVLLALAEVAERLPVNVVTSHALSTAATFTSPAGMTEAFDVSNTAVPNAVGETIQGNYGLQAAVGATGTRTATASNDADVGNAHTLALKPR